VTAQLPSAVCSWFHRRGWRPCAISLAGSSGSTWIVETALGTFVVKDMARARPRPAEYEYIMGLATAHRCGPALVASVAGTDSWYAVLEFVHGIQPRGGGPEWQQLWTGAASLLHRMRGITCEAVDLQALWLARVKAFAYPEPQAREMLVRMSSAPSGRRCLAHGDFSAQNLVLVDDHAVLIDWEQAGAALPGFDAGFAIAVARLSDPASAATVSQMTETLDLGDTVEWFVRLGLLRLLLRAHTLPLPEEARTTAICRIRRLLDQELARPEVNRHSFLDN
jgi:hypothetical protein